MKNNKLGRRDFIKLMGTIPVAMAVKPLLDLLPTPSSNAPHIIVLVYDAWSARNASLYGYPRQTMPSLDQFAQTATVYHRHYATAPFTTPGTASLLTGLYPWEHRAINLSGSIVERHARDQIFAAAAQTHATIGYSQNVYSDAFLYQAGESLQTHLPISSFDRQHIIAYDQPVFKKDAYVAFSSFEDNIFRRGKGLDGSLFLGPLVRLLGLRDKAINEEAEKYEYPTGLPTQVDVFTLEDLVDGAIQTLNKLEVPSLVYLHFFPPHDPYRPLGRTGRFFENDGHDPVEKPTHPLAVEKATYEDITRICLRYDRYLASWDIVTAKLYDFLKASGLADNSYIFLTSDHGEMFERGETGHSTSLLYEPLMRVPLIVKKPGQNQRVDVRDLTSNVDLLPTIAHLSGNPIPAWAQGEILPELGGKGNPSRSVYSMNAMSNSAFAPLTRLTFSLTKENHRLTAYQYDGYKGMEFYDLEKDPEEMDNLYPSAPSALKPLEEELLQKLNELSVYPVKK
jgi:arylsulfatase A-like enzyme